MVLKVAERGAIDPFIVMDVMRAANERVATGANVLHLEVGQPATPAPRGVLAAAKAALDGDRLGYTDALGLAALRQRIADSYHEIYGLSVDPARVVVTTGSSGAFVLAFIAAFEAGDRVALASPGYPAYRNILRALGVEVVNLELEAASGFQPTLADLDAVAEPLDGLIVASPANPTGTMLSPAALAELAVGCEARGIRLISDEIYHGITFGERATSALASSERSIVINSFSKYYSMTGWRLGWMVVPPDLSRAVECLAQNLYISPPALSQRAAIAAFDCREELDGHVVRYARNRTVLMERLPKAGFGTLAPADGAFYLYADVSKMTNDSLSFCRRMLAEINVAATPGVDFDPGRGSRWIRFSFAGSTEDMAAAAERLIAW